MNEKKATSYHKLIATDFQSMANMTKHLWTQTRHSVFPKNLRENSGIEKERTQQISSACGNNPGR